MGAHDLQERPADAWQAVEVAFGALGRTVLVLDSSYHVVRASEALNGLVCEGTSERILGHPISDLLGSRVFVPGDSLHRALSQGHRAEGRRAFIRCPRTGAQLVSLSVAPLPAGEARVAHPRARFMVVIRPADMPGAPDAGDGPHHYGLVARSPAMLQIIGLIEALTESEATVLVTGESGTGKEVIARAVHAHSPRAEGPFVAVNTGAVPGPLLESELFGHVKGAFTGAMRDRRGSLELAAGGTLFLDEIGEMSPDLQVKLLRVVQEREYQRLGDSRPRPVDARIIAATHQDLGRAVAERRFREDLYYRLRVVPIHIPPLRARPEDIEPLALHLLARITTRAGRALRLSPDALEVLQRHPWPGNVRQLENALEHAVALCQGQTLQVEHLPPELRADAGPAFWPDATEAPGAGAVPPPAAPSPAAPLPRPREDGDDEAERLRATLAACRWNRQEAADALGISRTTLWRRMRKLGLG